MLVDRFTNYRSRYGYPTCTAIVAEVWWRLEHAPLGERVRTTAYRRRKAAERRGIAHQRMLRGPTAPPRRSSDSGRSATPPR